MNAFVNTNWTHPINFLYLSSILFAVVFLRYVAFSGIYHYIFFFKLGNLFRKRQLHARPIPAGQVRKEIYWSAITSLIFSLSGVVMIILWQMGYVRVYTGVREFPLWLMPISLLLYMFIHETYYYWLHRWMHTPRIYRMIHRVHHDSVYTSSWTSFSFHPYESVLQALIIPVLLLFLPIHIYVLFLLLILMTVSAIINHAGVEIYPRGFEKNSVGKWLIGAVHHDLHHKKFRYNYGLYFTFWDKWMKTESPEYENIFQEKTEA